MCCGDNKNSDKKACQCAGHESAEKLSAVWFSSTQTRLRLTRGRFDLCSTFQDASRTYATTLRRSTTQTSVFPAVSPLHVEVANLLQLRVILAFLHAQADHSHDNHRLVRMHENPPTVHFRGGVHF